MVKPLDRKLFRDLTRLRGQVITIALVVACGIASYAAMRSTYRSLERSRDVYYDRYRFPDAFATLKRAPRTLEPRLEAIPGIAAIETRVVEDVTIPIATMSEPATGRIVSLPSDVRPRFNAVHLRRGRMLDARRSDEILLLESFAEAHGLEPGDSLPVVLNGRLRDLRIVGIALSPEYVFPIGGLFELTPDARRFAVLWTTRDAVAPAVDMEGAFNDLLVRLEPEASESAVIAALDEVLEPYGTMGAHGRDRQVSNYVLENELAQLEAQANVIPLIFLGVAAFLLNLVLARLVQLQREQIAALKALGYSDREIGSHYLKLVSVIVVLGATIGLSVGRWLGSAFAELYMEYFRFPMLDYRLDASVAIISIVVSLVAALAGGLGTVRAVMKLPPAEAMRPPAPAMYSTTWLDRVGVSAVVGQSARMVLREVERRPLRLILSSVGIAMAVGILVVGSFFSDAMNYLMDVHFRLSMQEDIQVSFRSTVPERARRSLGQMEGVTHSESLRMVPVRMRHEHIARDSTITGIAEDGRLRRVVDTEAREIPIPEDGIALSRKLAEILRIDVGDAVEVEVLEGRRERHFVRVTSLIDDLFGLQGYMRRGELHRLLGEPKVASMALLSVDPRYFDSVQKRLRDMPIVAGVTRRDAMIETFREQSAEMVGVFTLILAIFAATITVGVVYNNARIALSMKSRELASLRVLGFTRGEISGILLGELAMQVLLAIPIGFLLGRWGADLILLTVDPENYRLPAIVSLRTYAFATTVALGSALLSALLVRRKLDHLDLIGVLKARE